MDEKFVRVRASGGGYISVERGIETASCAVSFPLDDNDKMSDDDLREMVKLLHQAWADEPWEGKEDDEGESVMTPD